MSAELDLTALRAELKAAKRVAKQHMNRADKAEAERDTKAEACRTMGHIIELQGRWAVEATGSQDLIGDDGDGDWDVVWDRVTELGGRARDAESARRNWQSAALAMQTRAETAEAESKVLRSAVETSNDAWAALTTRADNLESS